MDTHSLDSFDAPDKWTGTLSALADPALAPVFWQAERLGLPSAWWQHVPFAHWIVCATAPRLLVELGTHAGVSYTAFCQAVVRAQLPTRCHAVDTWHGDPQSGEYGEEVYEDLRRFHDERFGAFSTLLRCTFEDALGRIEDGAIDLLHIDGFHSYEAAHQDFQSWLPKLSDRAIVLFHDTNERSGDFGVWRLWEELRGRYPGFEFLHGHGLGVLAVGKQVPAAVAALCELGPAAVVAVRTCFARLGERWLYDTRERLLQQDVGPRLAAASSEIDRLQTEMAKYGGEIDILRAGAERAEEAARQAATRATEADTAMLAAKAATDAELHEVRRQLATEAAARRRAADRVSQLTQELRLARHQVATLSWERNVILGSALWRVMEPLRVLGRRIPFALRRRLRRVLIGAAATGDSATAPIPATETATALPATAERSLPASALDVLAPRQVTPASTYQRIVFISGEPENPGHVYRVQRYLQVARALGAEAEWLSLPEVTARGEDIARADLLVIWRAANAPEVAHALWIARSNGVKILFDVDDLMFDPSLASRKVIDGIRSQGLGEGEVAQHFQRVREVAVQADSCSCTTEELAEHLRGLDRITFVLPNLFDAATLRTSRLAVRRRGSSDGDIVRIGYAAGTRTHQRDFRNAAIALGDILRERPQCRLVLFRDPDSGRKLLDPGEFSALATVSAQIEWRDRVPLAELPNELARFDINLAPLEVGNPFCEAKSELKYVEAALTEVCTIASPTGPLRRAIADGVTGRLAETAEEWGVALRELIDDPPARRRMAHAAYLDALARFGPQEGTAALRFVLDQLSGNDETVARAFQLEVGRRQTPRIRDIALPDREVVFAADGLGDAEVTVVIPLHNYAHFVIEALESVRAQTLASLDLVVVDDASTDESLATAVEWAQRHAGRFNRVLVLRNRRNAGLGPTRNVGFDAAETPFVLPLDADNRLRPTCCAVCLDAIGASGAAFAYPLLQRFGDSSEVMGLQPFQPMRFVSGNYVDALAMVAKSAWAAVGGYDDIRPNGWDDYELWCSFVERGLWGVQVPEILADYRVHTRSMLRTLTDERSNKLRLISELERRHPWLAIRHEE